MRIVGFAFDDEAMSKPRIQDKAGAALKRASKRMQCNDVEPFLCGQAPSSLSRNWMEIFCHLLFATLIEPHACQSEFGFSGYHGPFD